MVTGAWRRSRPRPCCTSDQGWRTDSPISTTRVAQRRRSSISLATTRPITRNMTLRLRRTYTVSRGRSPHGCIRRRVLDRRRGRGAGRAGGVAAPGQIATLILPADTAWMEADRPAPALPKPTASGGIRRGDRPAAGAQVGQEDHDADRGAALKERGLNAAGRVAAATGARIVCDTFAPRCQRGAGRVQVERIPYFAEQIVEFMKDEQLILVGAKPPVSFFAYPNKPSWCTPEDCRILYLAHAHEDGTAALEALADAVKAAQAAVAHWCIEQAGHSGRSCSTR